MQQQESIFGAPRAEPVTASAAEMKTNALDATNPKKAGRKRKEVEAANGDAASASTAAAEAPEKAPAGGAAKHARSRTLPNTTHDYEMEATTCWPEAIRKVFDVLSVLLEEMTLKISKDGICVQSQEVTRVAMTHMRLKASAFERWRCERNYELSVFVGNFCDFIGGGKSDSSVLTVGIPRNKENSMRVEVFDAKNGSHKDNELPTFEPSDDEDPPDIQLSKDCNVIVMNSSDLRDIVKDILGSKTKEFQIAVKQDRVTFSGKGENGFKSDTRHPSSTLRIQFKEEVSFRYPIRYLKDFVRACSVNEKVILYIGSNQPLFLCYRVFTFGELWFALASLNSNSGNSAF